MNANNPRRGFQHLTGAAFSEKREVCKILNTHDYRCAPDLSLQDDRSFLYFKIRLLVFYSLFNLRFLPVSGGVVFFVTRGVLLPSAFVQMLRQVQHDVILTADVRRVVACASIDAPYFTFCY